jgi:hypothetical protein
MKTLRAVHEIHMTITPGKPGDKAKGIAPVRPEVKAIPPKTRFKAQNEAQEAELLASGAAVLADDPKDDAVVEVGSTEKKATKPKAAAKPKATEADAGAGGGEGGDGSELV